MEFHPLAEVLPLLEGEEFSILVEDIRANGLENPVVIYEGKILDGRNRFRACQEIGIQPSLKEFNGSGDPINYVLSMNVHRRHLSTSQRAYIAAQLATLKDGQNRSSANLRTSISQPEAAKLLNVSERSVQTAVVVRDHGTEEEKEAVKSGAKKASRVAENIRDREKRKSENRPSRGGKIVPPEGLTVEQWCRNGLALEAKGKPPKAAAKAIGFHQASYRQAKAIVQLADRTDLPTRDSERVRQTLDELNATCRLRSSYEAVEPIIRRVFGAHRNFKEANLAEPFERAVALLEQVSSAGSQLGIPHFSSERAQTIISQLEQARKQIGAMISGLKEVYA